jgi:hypothetical protein
MRKRQKTFVLHHDGGGALKGGSAGLENAMIVSKDPQALASEHYIQELLVLQRYDFVAVTERWEESMDDLKLFHNDHVE